MKMEATQAMGIHGKIQTREFQPPSVHPHLIEKLLDSSVVQFFLRRLTKKKEDGHCPLENIFQAYKPAWNSLVSQARFLPAFLFIELLRKMASAQKDFLATEVFGYPPRARALINTARSIGAYGLTRPQVFYSPLMVVWNFTQACNLKCKHCYQDAGRALPDELTLREQLEVVEQLIDLDVAILAFSGGEPLLSPNLLPVARRAHDGGMYVTIATNGTLLTREMVNGEALKILRDHKIEVCASFIVDPQYERSDFERLRYYIRRWKLYSPSITVLTPLPGTEFFRRVKEKLTTQNWELFDLVHAVLPTRLSLADFYREFCELYKIGYVHAGLGWESLAAMIRHLGSFPHLLKLMRSAWVMGDEAYYLAGHKDIGN